MSDEELVAAFVGSLECDQGFTSKSPPPEELAVGIDPLDWNSILWKPARIETPKSQLKSLYDDTLVR